MRRAATLALRPLFAFVACAWMATASGQSFCEPVAAEPLAGAIVLGNGTPGSITTQQLQAALDIGGAIRLDQGANPSTLVVTQTLVAGSRYFRLLRP